MAASLVPCPSCSRHVRSSEQACPFCRSALSANLAARAVPGTTQRLSRAAAFTFAATLAATGCATDPAPTDASTATDVGTDAGATPTDTGRDAGSSTDRGNATDAGVVTDNGGIVAMYGGPPGAADAGNPAPDDGGGVAPLYGSPPPAAGVEEPDDGGGIAPLYGLPAPVDAGADGSIGIRYGSPPRPDAGG